MSEFKPPKGDSYGAHGEEIVLVRRDHRPFRSIRERQRVLLWLSLTIFTVFAHGAAVWPALPSLGAQLGLSATQLAAVVATFFLPMPGILLVANRCRELVGDRQMFVAGAALFAIASAIGGLATSIETLLVARVVQGIGAGLCLAFSLSFIAITFANAKDQKRAYHLHGLVVLGAGVAGLVLGALLVRVLSWPAIFLVNLPLCGVALWKTTPLLDDLRGDNAEALVDGVGAVGLTAVLLLITGTATSFATSGLEARPLTLLALTVVTTAAALRWQVRETSSIAHLLKLDTSTLRLPILIATLTAASAGGLLFLATLQLTRGALLGPIGVGLALTPGAVVMVYAKKAVAPRLVRRIGTRALLVRAVGAMLVGLVGYAVLGPSTGSVFAIIAATILVGGGFGLSVAPQHELFEISVQDDGAERRTLFEACRFAGAGLGIVALAAIAQVPGIRATSALLLAAVVAALAALVVLVVVLKTVERAAPLPPDAQQRPMDADDRLVGAKDPDFLALGLGGTGMMAMLWSIARGRRAVGVELRGDPYLQFMQWRLSEDLYHHLAEIDRLILERYGEDRIPRRGTGALFRLSDCFFVRGSENGGGEGRADEVIAGFHGANHVGGASQRIESVDDRWVDGEPRRTLESYPVEEPTTDPDLSVLDRPFEEVLSSQFQIQVNAEDFLLILRRYLQGLERIDLEGGHEPRCRLFTFHRAVPDLDDAGNPFGPNEEGFVREADGRVRVRIEAVRELDERDRYRRIREPGTEVLDLGIPKLFMVSQGLNSPDAKRLGLEQKVVEIDHRDGRGPRSAEADYIVGLIGLRVGNKVRQRIASIFDDDGQEYWSRQSVIGHEGISEAGWMAIEVPDHEAFDPIEKGLVPPGMRRGSPEYYGAYKYLLRDHYLDQVALLTGVPKRELLRTLSLVLPRIVTVVEKVGQDALLAENGVVAGDSFGNGHFITRGGAVVGLMGHALRVNQFWQNLDEGSEAQSVRALADAIKKDTDTWLRLSEAEFRQPAPMKATADGIQAYERRIDEARTHRRSMASFDYRDDWSRLVVFPGRLYMAGLEPLDPTHPDASNVRKISQSA